ncbi:MAG: hypothetical protein LBE82_02995 [Chitinophagaceae bacterium]|jgi:hypothetical protein|nr:hypothetical protein [Chitinophagaceae bacterium]
MKFYRKTIVQFAVLLLVLFGSFVSCTKNPTSNNIGTWVSNPASNVTITFRLDSKLGFVNTSPEDLNGLDSIYLFQNGDLYLVRGDTLYYVTTNHTDPNWDLTEYNRDSITTTNTYGFIRTMLSPNKMKLQSFGYYSIGFYDMVIPVTEYIFDRKTN